MMALQFAPCPVLNQPGCAVRALEPMATGPTQRKRCITPPVQKQHRLFTIGKGFCQPFFQRRRDPAIALRFVLADVDDLDTWQHRHTMTAAKLNMLIAPGFNIGQGFKRRGRRRQHDGNVAEMRPCHRHVAGMIHHAIFLLERVFVFLVDHDQAKIMIGQEKG